MGIRHKVDAVRAIPDQVRIAGNAQFATLVFTMAIFLVVAAMFAEVREIRNAH